MDWKECCNHLGINDKKNFLLGKWAVDSRQCEKNTLFIALKGKKQDGHDFLKEVASRGAFGAIVSEKYQGEDFGLKIIKVEDPLKTLQMLATRRRLDKKFFVIGITGSVGKTTIKEFCYALLKNHKNVDKSSGSYNGQIGLPLSILNASENTKVLILEMGMTQKGEMQNLVQIARPNLVILSIIGEVHPEFFNDVEEIAYEKGQLFTSPLFEWAWVHQISSEFEAIRQLVQGKAYEKYGLKDGRYLFDVTHQQLKIGSETLSLPFKEEHFVENLLPAILLARHLKVTWKNIQRDIQTLKPFDRRFQTWILDDVTLIDDTFNNNPISMRSVMKNLSKSHAEGRLIGVLGEMADLGKNSQKIHEEIAKEASVVFDEVFCYGQETKIFERIFSSKNKKIEHFSDLRSLEQKLKSAIRKHDTVFIKGKNTNRLWEVVECLKTHLEMVKSKGEG